MLYIVYGAPCSGKSAYVANNKSWSDVVFDYDAIIQAMTGRKRPKATELINPIMNLRRRLILDYRNGKYTNNNLWVIATYLTQDLKNDLKDLAVEYIEMDVGIDTCLERLKADRDGRDIKSATRAIERYYIHETDTAKFYGTPEWKSQRAAVLVRDEYQCQLCKRKGISTDAETVHHINILSVRPDLALESNNLISLCDPCHGRLHDHIRDDLTTEGKQLQRKTNRKFGW